MKLAIDIAGTVISLVNGRLLPRNSHPHIRYQDIPAVHGACDHLTWLFNNMGDNLLLVAGIPYRDKNSQDRVLTWLQDSNMLQRTRIKAYSVHFLLEREQDETDLCNRLGVTHFVGNRAKYLPLNGVDNLYLLNPLPNEEKAALSRFEKPVKKIPSWANIFEVLGI